VMEYLHGETLGAKLKRAGGVLPVADAVDYILKVCDALEVVHRAGYIHRDIKPDNIIHCEDGRLVLIDFGAARHFVANQTATYTVMLTPSYAAPEQYSSAGRLDPRTDIYGLAATLYHLVTGVPPLPALDRTSGLDLPPPHLVEPKVGEALSRAIQQGLSMRMDELFVINLFLIARPFVSELISPTVIELSPEDTQETIIKAFDRIRPEGTIRLESGSYHIDTNIIIEKPLKLVGVSGSVSITTNHKSLVFRAEGDSQVQNISFQDTG